MKLLPWKMSTKQEKTPGYQWHEDGVAILVRLVILGWSGAILTLNYITIPGLPQQKIDPTFIASVFTGTLATFGVTATKGANKEEKDADRTDKTDKKPQNSGNGY